MMMTLMATRLADARVTAPVESDSVEADVGWWRSRWRRSYTMVRQLAARQSQRATVMLMVAPPLMKKRRAEALVCELLGYKVLLGELRSGKRHGDFCMAAGHVASRCVRGSVA